MVESKEILAVLEDKTRHKELFDYMVVYTRKKGTFISEQYIHALLSILAKHIQASKHKEAYSAIAPSKNGIYNWLRNQAEDLADSLQILRELRIGREHDLCLYAKKRLPEANRTTISKAYEQAHNDLWQQSLRNSREELWGWLLTNTRRVVLIEHFTAFWSQHEKQFLGMALQKMRRREEAEDLLQITYEKALRYLRHIQDDQTFPEHEGQLIKWSKIVMERAFLDNRKEQNRYTLDSLDAHPDQTSLLEAIIGNAEKIEDEIVDQELQQEIEAALQELSPLYREIFIRHWIRDQKATDIAKQLNKSLNTVQAQIKRVRAKLAVKLSARTIRNQLNQSPSSETRMRHLIEIYTPRDNNDAWVRIVLSLHIAGNNLDEIVELIGNQDESINTQRAIIQDCLDENLPRLFEEFYKKGNRG